MQIKDVRVVYAPPQISVFSAAIPTISNGRVTRAILRFCEHTSRPTENRAEYSPNNVPFKPKKHLTMSLDGVKENDFVFVLGYPGGTTRYRESQTVDYSEDVNFPFSNNMSPRGATH